MIKKEKKVLTVLLRHESTSTYDCLLVKSGSRHGWGSPYQVVQVGSERETAFLDGRLSTGAS